MSEDDNTSSGQGATPTPGSPATGNPASGGATPPAATLSLEEAMKRIAELEHTHGNAREELERHRKKLSSYEKAEKEQAEVKRLADEAQMSEIERARKQHADIQSQHNALLIEMQDLKIQHAVERYAHELGFLHPEIAVRLLDQSELECEDNGTPKNAKQLLEKLLKAMPELARPSAPAAPSAQSGTPPAPAQNRPTTPTLPAMNPGRTQIVPPGQTPPGKPPRLSDVWKRS